MKEKIFVLLLLITVFSLHSCDKEDFEHENSFNKSHKVWLTFKSKSNNSYKYTVEGYSWVGILWKTTITVDEGKIVRRSYQCEEIGFGMEPSLKEEWTENGEEIGIHKETAAFDPITLDEVYEKAKNEWLIKRSDTTTFFEIKNNGLISLCGYTVDGCVDDCFRGVNITSIIAYKK